MRNPIITQYKERLPKWLKSSVEITKSKGKQVLNESTNIYAIDDNESNQRTLLCIYNNYLLYESMLILFDNLIKYEHLK